MRECQHFYRFCRVWTANLELLKQSLSPARQCRGDHHYHPHHCRGGHHYHPHETAVVAIVIARKTLPWWPSLSPARYCHIGHRGCFILAVFLIHSTNSVFHRSIDCLSVTDSISYSVTHSISYPVTDSISYSVTHSISYPVIDSISYSVTDSISDSVIDSISYSVIDSISYSVTDSISYCY